MIKIGTSTLNQKRITIGTTEISKVYIGTNLVWTKQSYPLVPSGYGKLYNWYAVNDSKNIAANGWHVPTFAEWQVLRNYTGVLMGDVNMSGCPLVSPATWPSGSAFKTYGTNATGFSAKPAGSNGGAFYGFGGFCHIWLKTLDGTWPYYVNMDINNSYPDCEAWSNMYKFSGNSVRLIKDNNSLAGYTGNDGKTYTTAVVGTQVWMTENLRETKYRDLTVIPNVTNLTAWAALTTGAYCWYDNNPGYE